MFRPLALLAVATACTLVAACGTTRVEKTVVVNPPAGSTVVVPENGKPHVVSPGA